jgi:hypothetical protein
LQNRFFFEYKAERDDADDDAQAVVCSSTAVVVVVVALFGSCGQLLLPEAL